MFKRIGALPQRKLYVGFDTSKEKVFPIEVDGYKLLEGYKTEAIANFCVTESGNYIGGYMLDVVSENMNSPALGFFLKASGEIMLNGKALAESTRQKITHEDDIVICGEDCNCRFYPIKEDENEYFMEYDKNENSVGIISVRNGVCKKASRIILKFGCAFSQGYEFITDNAQIKFFPECSISRILGDD